MNSAFVILPVFASLGAADKIPRWQVGHYGPHDTWVLLDDDLPTLTAAEEKVHYLNGGIPADDMTSLLRCLELLNANLRNIR